MNGNTRVIYNGPSNLNGDQIVVLVSNLYQPSANPKTGAMLQTWIMNAEIEPNTAQKTGADSAVCGSCPLRPVNNAGSVCYVTTWHAPLTVWRSWSQGQVMSAKPSEIAELTPFKSIRIGSYGDPAAVPIHVWRDLINGGEWEHVTGYTHQLDHESISEYGSFLMASVETSAGRAAAKAQGLRTFRIIQDLTEIESGEILCPATTEKNTARHAMDPNRITCGGFGKACGSCNGNNGRSALDIAVLIHGKGQG
tara:strand:+ start:31 stop:786 length:756 start_codon:yes stop_codon:yes gene_type:complete